MAERYCAGCGTRIDTLAEACRSCGKALPGTEADRRERAGKRSTAIWALFIGLVIAGFGYQFEGGARIIDTRRGPSTAGVLKFQIIVAGVAFVGYGVASLYRLRDHK